MDIPIWRMNLAVTQARITDEETPWHGSLVIVVRARTRQDAIAAVRLAEGLVLPDGRHVGLMRYLPTSLQLTPSRSHRNATESPRITVQDLQPRS
ncbi:hypothetical protein BJF78_02935 [Pseudonocardia sp. CNS-139]|nr:hypothetical protein BJF78_02935 [Pseudonocardia sp. CNS-139]